MFDRLAGIRCAVRNNRTAQTRLVGENTSCQTVTHCAHKRISQNAAAYGFNTESVGENHTERRGNLFDVDKYDYKRHYYERQTHKRHYHRRDFTYSLYPAYDNQRDKHGYY